MSKPALKEESMEVPTAPITKAGPAFTQERVILSASDLLILCCEKSSAAMDAPTGKPAKSEKITTAPARPESLKIFLKNLSVFLPKKSTVPLKVAKDERTRKGKSDGTIISLQSVIPFLAPSAQTLGNETSKAPESTQIIMQQSNFEFCFILVFIKKITHHIYIFAVIFNDKKT